MPYALFAHYMSHPYLSFPSQILSNDIYETSEHLNFGTDSTHETIIRQLQFSYYSFMLYLTIYISMYLSICRFIAINKIYKILRY